MVTTEWLVANPTTPPTVYATIKTNSWQMTTETAPGVVLQSHNFNVSLSVLQYSHVLLVCRAPCPVFWHSENLQELPQNRTYNPFLEEKGQYGFNARNYSEFDQYSVPAIEQYESLMTFRNFTMETVAICSCVKIGEMLPEYLTTRIQIGVHPAPSDMSQPQILQQSFNFVRPSPSACFQYWERRTAVSIIYSVPPGMSQLSLSVETPDHDTLYPTNEDDTNQSTKNDITVATKSISHGFRQFSLIINRCTYYHEGKYWFVIRGRLANGTEIIKKSSFYLYLDTIDFRIAEPVPLNQANVSVSLTSGFIYLARFYLPAQPVLEKTRLVLEERVPNVAECNAGLRLATEAYASCGVVGFSLFNENTSSQVGLQITLKVKKSCILTVITAYESSHHLNETVAEVVHSSLFISMMDVEVFGDSSGAVSSTVARTGALVRTEPPLEYGYVAYSNDTIQMQCILPKCHLLWPIWDKDDEISQQSKGQFPTNFPPIKGQFKFHGDGSRKTFYILQSSTWAFILEIKSLNISDSGKYKCHLFAPSSKHHVIMTDVISLIVRDPIKPQFDDGKYFYSEKRTLLRGDTLSLQCNVTGDPKPTVSWFLKIPNADGTFTFEKVPQNGSTLQRSQPGVYICNATNTYGFASRTFEVNFAEQTSYVATVVIASAVVGLALTALLFWWLRRRAVDASFKELSQLLKNPPETVPFDDSVPLNDQVQYIPYNRERELSRDLFTVTAHHLGEGEFGYIFKGELKLVQGNATRSVAVKMPRDSRNRQHFDALVDEVKIMCQIRPHVNVLALVGACTENVDRKQLFVLTEFCDNGSLRDYLIQNRMKLEGIVVNDAGQFLGAPGAVEALLKYAYQAANGMEHLASERIIHRDLALRNLLLTANHIVKISDFGLSKKHNPLYNKGLSLEVPMPVFWMSPESLFKGQFTYKSDVWSFGVVLWEMFSLGRKPYPDHIPDTYFLTWLRAKEENRMGRPSIVSEDMYKLMLTCWKENPDARPTFSESKRIIAGTLEQISPSMYQSILLSLSEAWLRVCPNDSTSAVSYTEGSQSTQISSSMDSNESSEPEAPVVVNASEVKPLDGQVMIIRRHEDVPEKRFDAHRQKENMSSGTRITSGIETPQSPQSSRSASYEGDERREPETPVVQPSAVDASKENPLDVLLMTYGNKDIAKKRCDALKENMSCSKHCYAAPTLNKRQDLTML